MEFTKENLENAPEGSRLEWQRDGHAWEEVYFVGYRRSGHLVAETNRGYVIYPKNNDLRITLPKRKVTVQLWRTLTGDITSTTIPNFRAPEWTLLGEHTFEIEGE